jgi:RHS repeat-associated protein
VRDNRYFTLDEVRRFRLSPVHQTSGEAVEEISYHQLADRTKTQKRLVEHARKLFFNENLSAPLPFRELGRLGLPYETYKLALTDGLLNAVFPVAAGNKLDQPVRGVTTARQLLNNAGLSGYLSGADLAARFAPVPPAELAGQYWIRSGIAGFAPDAAQHFYLPERYTDPFGNVTTLEYDPRDLFVASSSDALGNTSRVTQFDFRVLAPLEMKDINDNLSEVFFDVLGLTAAMAVKGKGNEGDNLTGFSDALANLSTADLATFFNQADLNEAQARLWLGNTTARHVYYFGEIRNADGSITWGEHPSCACGILREKHVGQLTPGEQSLLQTGFEYSDGLGSVVVKKVQAEPATAGQPLRWAATGKTILNNKGKPVKQFEPYFCPPAVGHRFEDPPEVGVTPVIYYDAAGRTVRTEMPDGSFSRVEFSPWHVRAFDPNDTVKEPGNAWFASKTSASATAEEKRAAQLSADHADTPAVTVLDSLGRDVIAILHNRVRDAADALQDEKYLIFTKLDAEGKPLWIRDARKNLVMQYITPPVPDNQLADPVAGFAPCYDIAGNLLFQHSMDAGSRWMLNDAAGKPMLAWDSRGHTFRTDYDPLHRPAGSFVKGADPLDANRDFQFEKMIYGDTPGNGLTDAKALNLRGKPYQHHDTAGLVTSKGRNPATGLDEAFDFKGNLLRGTRQLVNDYKGTPDWSQAPVLDAETFSSGTRYDALNRPIQLVAPHSNRPGAKCNVIRPGYNEANLLERVDVWLEQIAEPTSQLNPTTANLHAVANIDYNAKGQRISIDYGNGSRTAYTYDPFTFRLANLRTTRTAGLNGLAAQLFKNPSVVQDLRYTYDPVGNITEIHDDALPAIFFDGQQVEPISRYLYDALYRLIEAKGREHAGQNNYQPAVRRDNYRDYPFVNGPNPNDAQAMRNYSERYDYDPVGNFLKMAHSAKDGDWTRRYSYSLNAQPSTNNRLQATSLLGDPDNGPYSAKYAYDEHGNMTAMPHLPVMEWDFKDQLHATQRQVLNNAPGEKTFYVYDSLGQRVRKVTETANGKRKNDRIYLGGFEIYRDYDATGNAVTLQRETLHVMDDKQRIALVETRTQGNDGSPPQLIRYQFGNHLGSASLELDHQAQIISYEEYHPYGTTSYQAVRSQTETPKRYRYTGKERDEETGFGYHGARYHAPWLGRWTSCDPAGLIDGLNMYLYVKANPLRFFDPNGRQTQTPAQPDWILSINQELGLDPSKNGQTQIVDLRPQAQRAASPMGREAARAYGNQQAAGFRTATGMNQGATVQAGHTAAARHASESGISKADWDTQAMQQLHSRKGQGVDVTVIDQAGNSSVRTRHTAQEGLIDAAVDRSRDANGGTLTPQGQLDAASEVKWRTEGTGLDQREVDIKRQSGIFNEAAAIENSPKVQARRAANAAPAAPEAAAQTPVAVAKQETGATAAVAKQETAAVARSEAGLLRRAGGLGGIAQGLLVVYNIYLTREAYKKGTNAIEIYPAGPAEGLAVGSVGEGVLNAAGALQGAPEYGTMLRRAAELGSTGLTPAKLWNAIKSGASPTSIGMGAMFGAFR